MDAAIEFHTMTSADLQRKIDILTALATEHNCRLVVALEPAAQEADIAEVETFVEAPLPSSLRAFLQIHNGISLAFHDSAMYEVWQERSAAFCSLEIYSTHRIIEWTKNFREYIDAPTEVWQRTLRCFDFANVLGILSRIVFYLDAPRVNGEYAILNADIGCGNWLNDLDSPSTIVIANSVEEFIQRAFDFMFETKRGFSFWAPKSKVKLPRPSEC